MPDWEFIVTEFVDSDGEEGERYIWEVIVKALKGTGEGIAILNYSDFNHNQQRRYQPDILLVSRDWGLAVIEVETCTINQIVRIRANQWKMCKFYARHICPFKQGENQLWQIMKRCDRKRALQDRVPGRVIVALPLISRDEWRERGFEDDHHTCPPIIFGDELSRRSILNSLKNGAIILRSGDSPFVPNEQQWKLLKGVILGHPSAPKPSLPTTNDAVSVTPFASKHKASQDSSVLSVPTAIEGETLVDSSTPVSLPSSRPATPRRVEVLVELRSWMSEVDIQQVKIGMQIPPGPQRIRGIAGSGKTLLLCQKAARMHIQYPDWDIALVFFTRSLYELLPALVRQWLEYWSDGAIAPDTKNGKLKVLHAWGSRDKPGLYSLLRDHARMNAVVSERPIGTIPERLAASCKRLLENVSVEPMFDAVLIDEGQDLVVDDEWKYGDKQAIYWLAWQSLRPVNTNKDPKLKRLIWAYDEAQSLDALGVPSYGEIFGEELGGVLSGKETGPVYKGGIKKSEVMKRCYRTPGSTLIAAHAIGMGLLRREGMLSGFTRKADWEKIGYEVTEGSFTPGNRIALHRSPDNSPNPIPQFWGSSPLEFEVYEDRESQLQTLVEKIRYNLDYDGLQPSRDILVIILGADQLPEEQGHRNSSPQSYPSLQLQVANTLQTHGIHYYIPGAASLNRYPEQNSQNADRFWWDGAITISRMYRAKGHEAPMVYVLGLELLAQDESNLALRNQLFVAMTRSMAWVHLSGIKDSDTHADYLLYNEIRKVIASGDTLKFTYRKPPKRTMADNE